MRFLALRTSYCSWFDKRIAGQPQDELFSHSLDLHVHSPCSLLAVTHLPIHRWIHSQDRREAKKVDTILDFCVSSLRRGHANLLCIVPIFTDDAEAFRTGNELPPLPMTGGFPASLWWRAQARLEKLLGGSGEHHRAGHWLKFSTSNQMASVYTSRAHLLPPVQERPSECEHPYPTGGSTALQSRL